jgi:hypothetical protein
MTSTSGVMIVCQLSGPCLLDYTPKIRPLTKWEQLVEYFKALYR